MTSRELINEIEESVKLREKLKELEMSAYNSGYNDALKNVYAGVISYMFNNQNTDCKWVLDILEKAVADMGNGDD